VTATGQIHLEYSPVVQATAGRPLGLVDAVWRGKSPDLALSNAEDIVFSCYGRVNHHHRHREVFCQDAVPLFQDGSS